MHSQTWAKHIPQTLRVSFILPVIPSVSLIVDWWFLYYDKFYEGILKFGVMGKRERERWTRQRRNGDPPLLATCQCKVKTWLWHLTLSHFGMKRFLWLIATWPSFCRSVPCAGLAEEARMRTVLRCRALMQHLEMRWSQESEDKLKMLIAK